jgi:hypothetical protein
LPFTLSSLCLSGSGSSGPAKKPEERTLKELTLDAAETYLASAN